MGPVGPELFAVSEVDYGNAVGAVVEAEQYIIIIDAPGERRHGYVAQRMEEAALSGKLRAKCAFTLYSLPGEKPFHLRSNAVLSGRWPAAVGMIETYPQRSAWTHS
jgi:hypothetical protein